VARRFHVIALGFVAAGLAVSVFVRDAVGLRPETLDRAEDAAARVFRQAGVAIVWIDADRATGRRDIYTVRIERGGTGALGAAAIGTRVATIYYGRVAQVARAADGDVAMVLGHAVAHELGHLLLETARHGVPGIMRAQMDVPAASQGRLLFSEDEARALAARHGR
jgi:hypothetical protein